MEGSSASGAHPTGTVTFLMTDVVGSTDLWKSSPEAMAGSLAEHERVVRAAIEASEGYEFGTAGDSFAVAFASPTAAIRCAVDLQVGLDAVAESDAPIEVRVGLHTGQADERDARYFGSTVNQTARIAARAGPHQILLSEATAGLVREDLPDGCQLADLGPIALRSFEDGRLFLVAGKGLSISVPAGAGPASGNLPVPATPYIGQAVTIDALDQLMVAGSAVTVLGMGGLGKSRITIEVARAASGRFPDGVWWIDLTPLSEGSAIAALVSTTLELTHQQSMSAEASMIDGLGRKRLLLVLDNCEHLPDAAADVITRINGNCPEVAILASSRVALGVPAETTWPLAVLDAESDGVELLVQRALTHNATLDPSVWGERDLVLLCERLDGLPLAIEMAAARLRTLSPREIIDRLDDRFRLLRNKDRHAVRRHQTLLAALDWSYELLDHDEQLLLDRLSVFPADFDLSAAEAVCSDEKLDELDVIDLLSSLVDKSLVTVIPTGRHARYRMLETVRQYCRDHLSEGALGGLRTGLLDHMCSVASRNTAAYMGEDSAAFAEAVETFTAEWDNFREAVRWAIAFEHPAAIEEMLRGLWDFCFQTFRTEMASWAKAALSMSQPPMSAYTMVATSVLAADEGLGLIEEALALVDESEPDFGAALCYGVRHWIYVFQGGPEALDNARRGLFHAPAMGPPEEAWQHANLAALLASEDPEESARHATQALEYIRNSRNPLRTTCVPSMAVYEAKQGRPEAGYELCDQSVPVSENAQQLWTANTIRAQRAAIALRYEVGRPGHDLVDALEKSREQRAWYAIWLALGEALPWLRLHCGDPVADTVTHFLESNGIWFRGSTPRGRVDRQAAAPQGAVLLRPDELVDYVLGAVNDASMA